MPQGEEELYVQNVFVNTRSAVEQRCKRDVAGRTKWRNGGSINAVLSEPLGSNGVEKPK